MRAADGLGKTFRLSKNLDVQLQGSVDRPKGTQVLLLFVATLTGQKGSQVLCTCLAIEAGMETLPK